MVQIKQYISRLTEQMKQEFSSNLVYIGLQGSYLREEATESSDIDIMVVLETLTVSDLDHYRTILQSVGHFEKSCGFICSRADLAKWNPLEIHHLLHNTKDYFGELSKLVPTYTEEDIRSFVKLSLNNLYHELCHRYIHADPKKNASQLPGSYKSVFFILQNLYFLKNGTHINTKAELLPLLNGKDRTVLERAIATENAATFDFQDSFLLLFHWCQETIKSL